MSMSTPMSSHAMPGSYSPPSASSICCATHAAMPSRKIASSRSESFLRFAALRRRSATSRWIASVCSA